MSSAVDGGALSIFEPRRLAAAVVDLGAVAGLVALARPFGLVLALAYAAFGDRLQRGTLGARLLGVRVVAATGGTPSRLQSISRNLVPLTFAVFFGYPEWSFLLGGTVLGAALAMELLIVVLTGCTEGLANLMSDTRVIIAASDEQ